MTRNASLCVKASCTVQVVGPLVLSAIFFYAGVGSAGITFLIAGLLFALVFWLWRSQLELCGRLLGVAANCLKDNGHLVSATMGLSILHGILAAPIVVFVVLATRVGKAVNAPGVTYNATSNLCFVTNSSSLTPTAVDCCAFQMAPAAQIYIAFASIIFSWLTFTVFEVRLFTISHVTARWYYCPAGQALPGSPVREAVGLAVGPHSGSLAMGGAVLAVADSLRQASESGRNDSIIACLARAIVSCVAALLEAFTRFATVRVAVTGERFMDAARSVVALLTRNALNTYAVWRFPPMVISMTAFALSACWTGLITLAFHGWGKSVVKAHSAESSAATALLVSTIVLAVIAFLIVFIGISFIGSILICVVDAVYVLYAVDVDSQQCTRPAVHEVFALVPCCHTVVQNPDGEIGYSPQTPQYAAQYPPQQQSYGQPQQAPFVMQAPQAYPQPGYPPQGYPPQGYPQQAGYPQQWQQPR